MRTGQKIGRIAVDQGTNKVFSISSFGVNEQAEPHVMDPVVATVGTFDGVHRGHRFLINQVKEVAESAGIGLNGR